MATAAEHFALYRSLRNHVLARHFALGRWHRANQLSLTNVLAPLPAELQGLPDADRELLRRWNVREHFRENPLMLSAHLHTMLAIEARLGSPQAGHILGRSLDAIASLVPMSGPSMGYITRWDAVGSDHWQLDDQSEPGRCSAFLIADDGRYQTCVPTTDPRHVARRTRETLRALRTAGDAEHARDSNDGVLWGYVDLRRRWEVSMDELAGLFGGWAIVDSLAPQFRPRLRPQAIAVAQRVAGQGWTLVRPCGGFVGRGAIGALSAFEQPVDHWLKRMGVQAGAPAGTDFDGALQAAGYGPVLAGPVAAHRALAWAGTLVLGPLLLKLGGLAAALGGVIDATGFVVGPSTVGLVSALAAHADCFDAMNDDESYAPIVGALLSALGPPQRWAAYLAYANTVTTIASNFPPFLALMGIEDGSSPAATPYVETLRARRRSRAPESMKAFGMDTAQSTAVAVALGAHDLVPDLIRQLDERHDFFAANGGDVALGRHHDDEAQDVSLALDYMAALALAWFHALRVPGAPPVLTPPDGSAWRSMPEPAVPSLVLRYLPEVRRAARAPVSPAADWPLFSGHADDPKAMARTAVLVPPVPADPPWEFTYVVGRWMRDVPTGIVLQDGQDYQIEATGTVDSFGPDGGAPCDDARWPLHRGLDPAAREGALLAYLGGYVHVGEATPRRRFLTWESMALFLRVNRPTARVGSNEAFEVSVRVWGPRPTTTPPGFIVEFVSREPYISGPRKGQPLRISEIGGTHGNGDRWQLSVAAAADLILDYGWRFRVRSAVGPRLTVVGRNGGRRYLRTVGDRARNNNLRSLPEG